MNVIIYEEKCVGSGQCVLAAPEVFDQRDSDGIVLLLQDTPPETELPNVREAAVLCPAAAIRIQEQLAS
ncbi:ferredoxin [Streptomyces sp. NPDC051954]|uniref:ferredoxin n=1 Tax=unclassified Streptomyces TaxID=2593676 RepID=UPI0034146C8D